MCRFLLPAASLANLGMTINARTLEHALRKMLSHPLEEVRQMGAEDQAGGEGKRTDPDQVRRPVPYLVEIGEDTGARPAASNGSAQAAGEDWCSLEVLRCRRARTACWPPRCTVSAI